MTAYREAIEKVKNAVAEADTVTPQSVYIVENGFVKASDSRMTAGTPWPNADHKFVVSAEPFERALRLMSNPILEIKENAIVVKEGRRRVTIPVILGDAVMHFEPEGDPEELPPGFIDAIKSLAPFMSDNKLQSWACGVIFTGALAIATNNVIVAACDLEESIGQDDFVVPDWAVVFLNKAKLDATEFAVTRHAITFWFEDGSWLRTAKLSQLAPEVLYRVLDNWGKPEFEIDDAWKSAYDFAVSFADDLVTITATDIVGGKLDKADARADAVSPVEGEALFNPKYLSKVLSTATHFDPGAWPAPAPFYGRGLRGFIIGRK